ncbi:MAG: alginate O-acetyltransferase AlgX-related protein, partial [Paracoccaceae bacterium]
MKRLFTGLAAAAAMMTIASSVQAQSTYGCEDLDGFHNLPSLEGSNGVFFRVYPELRNFHAFSDETIEDLAQLSRALRAQGTTLVYVPVPPKAMVMTDYLPLRAFDYGFDPQLATTVYDDMVRRLRLAGVVTANAREALVTGSRGAEPYFKTDYRLNALGSQLVAQSVAAAMAGVPGETVDFGVSYGVTGQVEVPSKMRSILQRHCSIELPKVMADVYDANVAAVASLRDGFSTPRAAPTPTQAGSAPGASNGRVNFGGSGVAFTNDSAAALGRASGVAPTVEGVSVAIAAPQTRRVAVPRPNLGGNLAIVGTEYTATEGASMAAAMQAATGMTVTSYAVPDGGAYGGMSAYLTGGALDASVLVWENPVYHNLAQFGDQPMRELIAAASGGGGCDVAIPLTSTPGTRTAMADLDRLDRGRNYTLFLDTDGVAAGEVKFTFTGFNGYQRTKFV